MIDESTLRADVRAFLGSVEKPERRPDDDTPDGFEQWRRWQATLADGGWGAVSWPHEYGGRELPAHLASVVNDEMAARGVPVGNPFLIGLGLVGPTLMTHGTPEQQRRWIPKILRADEVWCQLWSEPNAGSDVAGLRTRADRTSDGFVLNGQKVWTSGAHRSDFGICIARTDQDAPKHRGITCFAVPMRSGGVTVRPLRQITGTAEFNEVFMDDVFVPEGHVIGDLNDGWRVAITVLMNERHAIIGDRRGAGIGDLLRLASHAHGALRDDLMRAYVNARVFEMLGHRTKAAVRAGASPGPEGSIGKLMRGRVTTELASVAMRLLGAAGMIGGDRWTAAFLRAPAQHIAGGTDEIQRNIIGERVLGLPKEPQVDRDVPFRSLASR